MYLNYIYNSLELKKMASDKIATKIYYKMQSSPGATTLGYEFKS